MVGQRFGQLADGVERAEIDLDVCSAIAGRSGLVLLDS